MKEHRDIWVLKKTKFQKREKISIYHFALGFQEPLFVLLGLILKCLFDLFLIFYQICYDFNEYLTLEYAILVAGS